MAPRAVVIGAGRIGAGWQGASARVGVASHAAAWQAQGLLAGLADPDDAARQQATQHFSVPTFADHRAMLAQLQPQLVSVASPDASHAAVLRDVLSCPSVRGVLAEKPLACSAAEAAELVALAQQRGVLLAVNYSRRYSPGLQTLALRLQAGEFGQPRHVAGLYGKGIAHNGSHWLDWARWLLGEVSALHAFASTAPAYGNDPTPNLQLRFANGCTGSLAALPDGDYALFELDLLCSQGRLRFFESGQRVDIYQAAASDDYPGYINLQLMEQQQDLLRDVLLLATENLRAAVAQGRALQCSGADGLAALQLAERAQHALLC